MVAARAGRPEVVGTDRVVIAQVDIDPDNALINPAVAGFFISSLD